MINKVLSVGSQISKQLEEEYGWSVSSGLIQFFYAISRPLRRAILQYLIVQEAQLHVVKTTMLATSRQGDVVSNKIKQVIIATNLLMEPVDKFIQLIPLDSVLQEYPEEMQSISSAVASFMDSIISTIPVAIPENIAATIKSVSGMEGFDFFEGVHNYKDLRDKVEELQFRAARATALSNYASAGIYALENKLSEIVKFKTILELLGT